MRTSIETTRRTLITAAFALATFAPAARAADPATVTIGVTNASSDVTFYIADKMGFFAQEGLKPEYILFKSGTEMVAPLGNNQLDVGGGGASAGLYNAAARGIEIKIVADKGSMTPGYGFMPLLVRKDLIASGKVKSFADLKGLKIGNTSNGGSGDALLNAALIKGNLKFEDVDRIYLSHTQLGIALRNGAIAAAFITEPNASEPIKAGDAVRFAGGDEIYPNQQLSVLIYGTSLLKDREKGQKVMNAYVKAARVYNDALKDGHIAGKRADEIIEILVENTPIKDRDLYRAMTPQGTNPDGIVNAKSLRDDYEFYKTLKIIQVDINPDSLIDDSFALATVKALGPYRRSDTAAAR